MPKRIVKSGFRDWSPAQLPPLNGKTFVITGGNSGIGLEAAKMLATAGANIIIAARNEQKGADAAREVAACGAGSADVVRLDLSELSSVRAAAHDLHRRLDRLDGLVNNAGIMQTPQRATADGFELQLGTNHLGHFLLAGLLFDLVEKAEGRIVTVSSVAHRFGAIDFNDVMLTDSYTPTRAYAQSKLANLMFALELDRRLKRANSPVSSYACHPGYSSTQLQSTGPGTALRRIYRVTNSLLAQSAEHGAIPTVLCAAGAEAVPGGYYGPQSMGEMRGRISDASVSEAALNEEDAARLWRDSERLVDFQWDGVLRPG